jgi:hypothetical protein
MIVIEDYYHMMTMDENVNIMKLTHLISKKPLNLRAPFCTSTFTLEYLIAFLIIHTKENTTPIPYVYYVCKCLK